MAADQTLTADQNGAFEIALQAGTPYTVALTVPLNGSVSVLVHSGTSPVYAKAGPTVAVKDPAAVMIVPSSWATIQRANITQISLISANTATVSVYRE